MAKKLKKLYDPIGLGGVEKLELVYLTDDKILRESIERAYVPHDGKLWLFIKASFGAWNGPKRQYKLLTDGEEIITFEPRPRPSGGGGGHSGGGPGTSDGAILVALEDRQHIADEQLEEFVRSQIIKVLFE